MILDGKKISQNIYDDLKNKISSLKIKPTLAVILVGKNPASIAYIKQKEKYASYVGMHFLLKEFDENTDEEILIKEIISINKNKKIDGLIIQLPLPEHINSHKIIDCIDPDKDVDGFTVENIGKLFIKDGSGLIPSTAKGIKKLLDAYNISLKGKNITIIGKSNIVGKPLLLLFSNNDATVTICDIYTKNLRQYTIKADIVVSAVGKPNLITKDIIRPGSTIIDVGFNYVNGKICGDCDFEALEKENLITPTPGGIGPMTVAMLIENTYLAFLKNHKLSKKN